MPLGRSNGLLVEVQLLTPPKSPSRPRTPFVDPVVVEPLDHDAEHIKVRDYQLWMIAVRDEFPTRLELALKQPKQILIILAQLDPWSLWDERTEHQV